VAASLLVRARKEWLYACIGSPRALSLALKTRASGHMISCEYFY